MNSILSKFKGTESILFDMGNVLLDIDIQKSVTALLDINIDGIISEFIFPSPLPIFKEYECGRVNNEEFINSFVTKYKIKNLNEEKFWHAWNALFDQFDPKRIELLKKLNKNYDLYVLSNTNSVHVKKFNDIYRDQFHEEFSSMFKSCFYSNELKCRKPESKIYKKVIEMANINPAKSIFIDDLKENVVAAEKCGFNTHHLTLGQTILDIF